LLIAGDAAVRRPLVCALLLTAIAAAAPAMAQERTGAALLSRDREGATSATRIRPAAVIYGIARPNMRGHVTVIPYDPALPTIQVAIKGIGARKGAECTSKREYYWLLNLADIADGPYLAYRAGQEGHIGDAVIAYPPRPKAKVMDKDRVAPVELPRGYTPKELATAIDFDADGRADYVEVSYCCIRARNGVCPSGDRCRKAFRRNPRGWSEVWHREEC
jgi:hypothetical protein